MVAGSQPLDEEFAQFGRPKCIAVYAVIGALAHRLNDRFGCLEIGIRDPHRQHISIKPVPFGAVAVAAVDNGVKGRCHLEVLRVDIRLIQKYDIS